MPLNIPEDLKKKLPAEIVKSLEEAAKDTDIFVGSGTFIPKDRFDDVNQQAKDHKARADKFEKDLAEATKGAKNIEDLQKSIADLTAGHTKLKEEYEAKIAQQTRDYSINDALRSAKVRNTKALRALLNDSTITIKDGKIEGLDAQLAELKKTDPYLFEEVKPEIPGAAGREPGAQGKPGAGKAGGIDFSNPEQAKIAAAWGLKAPTK